MRFEDELAGLEDGMGEDEHLVGDLDEDAVEHYLGGLDIVEGDDLAGIEIGGIDEHLVGAARGRRRAAQRGGQRLRSRQLLQAAILRKRLQGAHVIRNTPPQQFRKQSIGFSADIVPAGGTAEIIQRPQAIFHGKRLSVATSIAPFFRLENFRVGVNPQFASGGPQPAEAYAGNAYGAALSLDPCSPGMEMALSVRNFSAADHPFSATCFGDTYK